LASQWLPALPAPRFASRSCQGIVPCRLMLGRRLTEYSERKKKIDLQDSLTDSLRTTKESWFASV
jgi:hypothetical protein